MKIEVQRIQRYQSWKKHVHRLLFTFQIISKNEASFFGSVAMQVDIDFQVTQLLLLDNCFLRLVNGRLLLGTRVQVKSVQIVIMGV